MPTNESQELDLSYSPPMEFGSKPWMGVAGLLGGAALATAGVFAAIAVSGSGGSARGERLPIYLIVIGVVFLFTTFRIRGCRLSPDGIVHWTYLFWFLGGKQRIEPDEIESFSLGNNKGKYTVSVKHSGGAYEIPQSWATLKDAQNVIDFGNRSYNASAEIAITDEKLLTEAAAFSKAQRFSVVPRKERKQYSERLAITVQDEGESVPVFVLKRLFRSTRAYIPENAEAETIRWNLVGRFWGRNIRVQDGDKDCEDIAVTVTFLGQKTFFHWRDTAGVYWSSQLTAETEARNPFTLKMYRGLVEGAGKKDDRSKCEDAQGPAVSVAVADGPASRFNLDVADESAWPWVRLALAAVWVQNRPTFSFEKTINLESLGLK